MSVRLKIGPYFLGDGKISPLTTEVSGETVGECLDQFMRKEPLFKERAFDVKGNLQATTGILINQVQVLTLPSRTPVNDGDEVSVIYATPGC